MVEKRNQKEERWQQLEVMVELFQEEVENLNTEPEKLKDHIFDTMLWRQIVSENFFCIKWYSYCAQDNDCSH